MLHRFLIIFSLLFYSVTGLSANIIGLDVRSVEEVKVNPAPRSINIPLDELSELAESKLDKNREIYVFCESGFRASKAKKLLEELGFKRVTNINSWRDWNKMKTIK